MKLDPSYLEYMTKEEFRVLTAIEIGMRNHELVPMILIERISHLKRACASKVVKLLLKNKFIVHENKKFDGYKLTYLGYDYLALQVFIRRGAIKEVMGKIGCGKESDIYKCVNENGDHVILKFTRLGRTSFRTIKKNRDYIQHRTSFSWLYLSRLSAIKEFTFMDLLYKNGFPTPVPIEQNRHGIVMSLINGVPMQNICEIDNPKFVFDQCFDLLKRLAENGLIHSDFNEFNLMVEGGAKVIMIDFPQMVSTKHKNADFYFNRDVECIHIFFERRFNYQNKDTLSLARIEKIGDLDVQVKASGFIKKEIKNIQDFDIDLRDFEDSDDSSDSNNEDEQDNEAQQASGDEQDNQGEEEEEEDEESKKAAKALLRRSKKYQDQEQEQAVETKVKKSKSSKKEKVKEAEVVVAGDEEEQKDGNFSPDLSEISFEDLRELQRVNQDLFSDDEGENPLDLNVEQPEKTEKEVKKELKEQKKLKKKKMLEEGVQEAAEGDAKPLKEQILIKEADLAEKAKQFIQKQLHKQLKQKHKILKKSNKTNTKVHASEYD